MTMYEKIQILCKNQGFEISNLGDKIPGISVTKGTISKWKTGAIPRAGTLKAIADFFGVSTEYLTSENSIEVHNINENHGIIGHTHAPVTIFNGCEIKITEQEMALLEIFKKLDVVKQAQLLAYAAELEKEV